MNIEYEISKRIRIKHSKNEACFLLDASDIKLKDKYYLAKILIGLDGRRIKRYGEYKSARERFINEILIINGLTNR